MFTKRLCALLLALVLSIGVMLPAQARGVKENYEEVQEAFLGYLAGDPTYTITEIVNWLELCGRYDWAPSLKEYAICLKEVEEGNFQMISGRIAKLRRDAAFSAYLEEMGFNSVTELETYAMAREAEANGDFETAINLYYETEVCDSRWRRIDLPDRIDALKYDEAMALYNADTYESAGRAAEMFAELAQRLYSDSADMARRAEAKREELRSISIAVNESLNGRNFTMAVTADGAWTVSNDASWLTLSRTSGDGNATITATMEENRTSSSRTAVLTFRCGNKTETVPIEQEKTDWITATRSGSTIRVEANGYWTAVEEADWLTLSQTSGNGSSSITMRMEDNVGSNARMTDVYFTCGTASTSVSITQDKQDVLSASIVGNRISVESNGNWTVTDDASWLTLSCANGTGNAYITMTMEANTTSSARTARITIRCGSETQTLTFRQEKTDSLSVSDSGSGNTRTITVTSNGSWTATENAAWLTLSKTSGTGNASITVTLQPNTTSSARTAPITFTCGNVTKTLSITQAKEDTLNVSTSGSGDTRTITVVSNGSWTATENAAWLTLSKTSGSGNESITATLQANTGTSRRTATVTFTCGSVTKTVSITQQKTDTLSLSTSGSGDTQTITVTSNGSWTATEDASWLTLSKTSGSGNATLSVNMAANTTSSNRTAMITFQCGSVTKTITITQQKTDTLSVSTSGSGNTRSINVTCNGNWTATENASWLTLSKTSGSGNESITATLQANTGTSRRSATVIFTCGSVTKNINITQEATSSGEPRFSVASEGSYGFALNSNGYYESQNKGRHSTTAACVVTISGTRTAYLDVINYAETGYDYGTIYAVDSRTNKLHELNSSSYNKSTVQTFTITLPDTGTHTLYITFKKDVSANSNNDSLQFKVRFSGSASAAPTFSVASEGSYGFALNSNGYYESQNKGHHSTTAACTVTISGTRTAYLDVINYAEAGWDYGTIYAVDSRTTKLRELKDSSYNKSTVQTFTIDLPDTGAHTLYITFKKDGSANSNNDSLQFKVRFSGSASAAPTFSVASEGSYGFALNSNGYYESQNKGRHSTTAACVVTISGTRTAYLDVINYAETGYDYGTIYAVDSRTNKLHELKSSSYNKSTVQTFTITLPDTGAHTLYITFKKDSSANANNDSLQFKVRFSGEASTSSATTSRNFSVTSATKNSNGTVTVRWTDSANNGPYTLHYKQRSSGSWTQDRNSNFRYWNASEVGSVSSKSATLMRLVPGYSYWIVVRDSDGAEAVYEYIAGTAPNFTEYGNTLAITIKRKSNGATADLSKYSASDIAANMATKEYFAYIRLDYSQLARAREYHGVMAIRDPRGQIIADNVATFNFNAGNYYTYWGNYGLEWYFGKVKDSYGSIPTGTYTMYLYLDGKFAASDTFTVGN